MTSPYSIPTKKLFTDHDLINQINVDYDNDLLLIYDSENNIIEKIKINDLLIVPEPYIISGSFGVETDKPPSDKIIFRHKFSDEVYFPVDFLNSYFWSETASTNQTVFSFTKNTVEFATATFDALSSEATFSLSTQTTFEIGDILRIISPTQDLSLAGLGWTLKGIR